MTQENYLELKELGYTIIRNLIDNNWLDTLQKSVDESFLEHRQTQLNNNNDIQTDGVALHVLLSNPIFIEFLKHLQKKNLFKFLRESFFDSNCIINSFSALDNLPNQPNFSAIVHRDLRFYSGEFSIMVNCLLMVDDFTVENGGTFLLPYSHLEKKNQVMMSFLKRQYKQQVKKVMC
jgi:ectoine hydroxylase-related dioxygenase (phytanoyl-CoA dioxygenase family)